MIWVESPEAAEIQKRNIACYAKSQYMATRKSLDIEIPPLKEHSRRPGARSSSELEIVIVNEYSCTTQSYFLPGA